MARNEKTYMYEAQAARKIRERRAEEEIPACAVLYLIYYRKYRHAAKTPSPN